jgi:hypothetical protein
MCVALCVLVLGYQAGWGYLAGVGVPAGAALAILRLARANECNGDFTTISASQAGSEDEIISSARVYV